MNYNNKEKWNDMKENIKWPYQNNFNLSLQSMLCPTVLSFLTYQYLFLAL